MDDKINPQAIFIVITVFILFINKVVEMVKARRAEKASRGPTRDVEQRQPQPTRRPPLQSTRRPTPIQTQPSRQRQAQPRSREPSRSPFQDVLTDLFEAAGVPTQQPPPASASAPERQPPPIPAAHAATTRDALTRAEREALDRLEKRSERSAANRRRQRGEATDRIAKLLLTQSAARQAIIVAEILGPPRALREIEHL